jgi:uncharacterized protein with GYD domain
MSSHYMIKFSYTNGSWARMLKVADDRESAVRDLMVSLGGSLERMWWDVTNGSAYVIADVPDAVTAAAVITATTKTGAFSSVEAHEMLTQSQLREALTLARSVGDVFHPPGDAAVNL